jgi:hypothetical protein
MSSAAPRQPGRYTATALAGSAQALGLDELLATAALARARNQVRGRLDEYLNAARSTT